FKDSERSRNECAYSIANARYCVAKRAILCSEHVFEAKRSNAQSCDPSSSHFMVAKSTLSFVRGINCLQNSHQQDQDEPVNIKEHRERLHADEAARQRPREMNHTQRLEQNAHDL